jgi:hypothetical protein
MSDSGYVKMASHSCSHINLSHTDNLIYEIKHSKEILEQKLGIECDSLIFPFGKYNDEVIKESRKYYKYLFRIGNGINSSFDGIGNNNDNSGIIYRVNGDGMTDEKELFTMKEMLKFKFKSFIKAIT